MTSLQRRLVQLATRALRWYGRTWRVRLHDAEGRTIVPASYRFGSEIYAIRERDLVSLSCFARYASFHTMIARGRDGDWASVVADVLGCRAVRGSSRHEPAASAMALVRDLRDTQEPAMLVVDGPLGPSGVAKEGVAAIARFTGRAVVPTAAEASARVVLKRTWSGMVIPLPFARVTVCLGAPIEVTPSADRPSLALVAQNVSRHFA